MSSDRHGRLPSERSSSEPVTGNVPWVDPYTDDVLARMRAQGPLSATVEKLRGLADSAFIGSAIDTTSNSATVYWHGPQPAAVNTVVSEALAAGITVNIIDAPFSAAQLSRSRARIREWMQELGYQPRRFRRGRWRLHRPLPDHGRHPGCKGCARRL